MELISLVVLFFMGLLLVIALYALYALVKKAVKDALREYDAEKEETRSGPRS